MKNNQPVSLLSLFLGIVLIWHRATSQITLRFERELYIALIEQCQSNQMYMNFSMTVTPYGIDFIAYPDIALNGCNPNSIIYGQYPHSAGLEYYQLFSCIDKNACNITRTATIITGPTCFAFYNKYWKGPTLVSYYLTVNCSQTPVVLQTLSLAPENIQGAGDIG
jgi:hypothetical protein